MDEDAEMGEDEDTEMNKDEGDDDEAGSDKSSDIDESESDDEDEDAEKNEGDEDESESENEDEDDMDTDEDMPNTQESMGSSHSATDKHELNLRDTPENITDAVLHEFLSTVTTLYYRKLDRSLGQHLEWTRQEMSLQLEVEGKRHSGKTDGALLLFESKGGTWVRGDNKLWVIVENKRVTTGGRTEGRHPTMRRNAGGNPSSPCRKWGAIKRTRKPTVPDWLRWGRVCLHVGQVQRKIPFWRGHRRQGNGAQVEGDDPEFRSTHRNTKRARENMEDCVCACTQVVRGVVCRFAATGGSAWVKIVDSHHATVISQLQRVCA